MITNGEKNKYEDVIQYLLLNSLVAEHLEFIFYDAELENREVTNADVTEMLHQILGDGRLEYTGRDLVPAWRYVRDNKDKYRSFYFAS